MSLIDDILEKLRLQGTVFSRSRLLGDWGFAKDARDGAPFYVILSGEAWLRTAGEAEARQLGAGDLVILPRGEPHQLLSTPKAEAVPFRHVLEIMTLTREQPVTRFKAVDLVYGQGEERTRLISGVFEFFEHQRNPLLAVMPSVMILAAQPPTAASSAVATISRLLDAEMSARTPGSESICGRLADILFIQLVRHHLATADGLPTGWLRGIVDKDIGPALALMHRSPNRPWSVADLAREAGMSRSLFAERFHAIVGQAPLAYLTGWRMYLAARHIAQGPIAVSTLAVAAGYRSEVSFSKAFKRWAGRSPAEYRRWLDHEHALDRH